MNIVHTADCTRVIGAPDDMKEPACVGLPVMEFEDEHGRWSVSFWQPSDEERAMLAAGAGVCLHVRATGRQHPVVALGVLPSELMAPKENTP